MTYSGATESARCRKMLGEALEALQQDVNIPKDVLNVAENIAKAIGALFEAENASSELDGKSAVRHAMSFLSQTLALLQDVRSQHHGIDIATQTLAEVMSRLYPLRPSTVHPSAPPRTDENQPRIAQKPAAASPGGQASPRTAPLEPREKLEANIGATTESNFFVGFSGEISEGGVFVATYMTLPLERRVEIFITLPGGYEMTILGTVLFVRDPMDMDSDPGIGVQFENLDKKSRELILRFIRKRPPLFFDF